MSVKSWLRRAHCWLALCGLLGCLVSLNAQIGKDHMRVIGYPPVDYDIRIYQRFDKSDYTGAMFHSPFGGLLQGFGTLLDEGVTVFKVQPEDVFNEKNIQAGEFAPLNNDFLDFSQPVFLGFRTPSVNFQSPFPGFPPPAYGWAELTHTEAQLTLDRLGKPIPASEGGLQYTGGLQILDHAVEYGGEGIVVGENQNNSLEGVIPVSRFGQSEILAGFGGTERNWNAGDFDGDGDVDLLLPHASGGFQLWKQNDTHVFELFEGDRITTTGTPDGPVDLDGDGDLDVWLSRDVFRTGKQAEIWINNGDGSFNHSDVELPVSLMTLLGDLDSDGDFDAVALVSSGAFTSTLQNWLNDGSGNFSKVSSIQVSCFSPGLPADLADLDGDRFLDLFYGCDGIFRVALNQGDGTFKETGRSFVNSDILAMQTGYNLAAGDVDGDGDVDIMVPNINFNSALWLNDGTGDFQLGKTNFGYSKSQVVMGDIDTDGDLDILLHTVSGPNSDSDPVGMSIYWNEGPDLFFKGDYFRGGEQFSPIRLVDIDQDDDLDIVTKHGGDLIAYHNSIEYVTPAAPGEGIQIPDEDLKRGILEALGKKLTEIITDEDMLELISLDLSISKRGTGAAPISDFTGLEKATRLKSLDLTGGIEFDFETGSERQLPAFDANDFGFLSSLAQLTTLKLAFNGLMELELPANLDRMEILDVSSNALSELKIPSEWTQLKEIHLGFNQISQLHLPESMSFLERLSVPSNEIAALQIPNGLVNLKTLSVSDNNLQSITLPPDLLSLSVMYLSGNQIETLEVPEQVGTQSDFLFVAAGESVRSFKASERWQNALFADSAFIRADQLQIDDSGHVEFPVFANQGAIVVEKSTDLKNWKAIQRIPVRHPNARPVFRDPEVMAQGAGFYRVQLRQ